MCCEKLEIVVYCDSYAEKYVIKNKLRYKSIKTAKQIAEKAEIRNNLLREREGEIEKYAAMLSDANDEHKSISDRIARYSSEISELNSEISACTGLFSGGKRKKLQAELEQVEDQLRRAEDELKGKEKTIRNIEKELANARAKLEEINSEK